MIVVNVWNALYGILQFFAIAHTSAAAAKQQALLRVVELALVLHPGV